MKPRSLGFSLLEMIGVLSVMAILAGALAPSVFQMLEEAYQDAEQQSLAAIAGSLQGYIKRNQEIPTLANTDWPVAIADYASLSPQRVLVNEKNFNRRLYADPMFFSTSNQSWSGYTQTQGLAAMPNSPRLMLVSNLDGSVTATLNTNTRFSDVWDQTADALLVESDTLQIERINLAPLFVRAVLSNANNSQAGFALEGGAEGSIAAASGGVDGSRTVFVLAGTRLDLNAAPYPGAGLLVRQIVNDDASWRYQTDGFTWAWVD